MATRYVVAIYKKSTKEFDQLLLLDDYDSPVTVTDSFEIAEGRANEMNNSRWSKNYDYIVKEVDL